MSNGRICYIEIPATNVESSATFYTGVFGWKVRVRADGERAFDDADGAVSGSWVLGRPPAATPGVLVYIMVEAIDATLGRVIAAAGQVVTGLTPLSARGEAFATFRDPAGNLLGLYQGPTG
jgi:hypothetical protein